jgi:glycerol kinase
MVFNHLLMQFQADQLGVPVIRPQVAETTALGAAYAAGLAVGLWPGGFDELRANWARSSEWQPQMAEGEREGLYAGWKKAVTRSFGWVEG